MTATALMMKSLRDRWRSVTAWAVAICGLCILQLSVYPTVVRSGSGISQFIEQYPDVLKKVFRLQDYTTGPGYLGTEVFSLMVPLVLIAVGAAWGASTTAEEEERGSADLLLTMPVSRSWVLLWKSVAGMVGIALVAGITYATIFVGSGMVDLTVNFRHLFEATAASALLGVLFGGVGLFAGVLLGRRGPALGIATGLALICFVFYSLSPLVDTFDAIAPGNPFEWAIGGIPLSNGVSWEAFTKLGAVSAAFLLLSGWALQRKDIHAP